MRDLLNTSSNVIQGLSKKKILATLGDLGDNAHCVLRCLAHLQHLCCTWPCFRILIKRFFQEVPKFQRPFNDTNNL